MKEQQKTETMEINCNIVRDLLPSYLDEICSDDSKQLIENHTAVCEACRESLVQMKKTELICETKHIGEIDYLKKIKSYYLKKNQLLLGLLLLFSVFVCRMVRSYYGTVPETVYEVLLPMLIFVTYFTAYAGEERKKAGKMEMMFLVISIFFLGYAVLLGFWCLQWVEAASYPFGMQAHQLGPFVVIQLQVICMIELIMYALCTFFRKKKTGADTFCMVSALTTAALSLGMQFLLCQILEAEQMSEMLGRLTGLLFIEGIVSAAGLLLYQKHVKIKEKQYNE